MVDFARGIARGAIVLGGLALPCVFAPAAHADDLPVPVVPAAPVAQAMSEADIRALPPEYQRAPIGSRVHASEESSIGADGVETITRTRRIARPLPLGGRTSAALPPMPAVPPVSYDRVPNYGQPYAPVAGVMTREQWIEECERRTHDRGRTRSRNAYDCAGALDSYMVRYNHAAPAGAATPQVTYVPMQYQQQQRVIVRETVREEIVPGAARVIPARPAPRRVYEARPIKGN